VIHYRSFTKRFGGHRAVRDLCLDLRPGEVTALLGPNGSGKTTTLKAAAGLIVPTTGEVLLGDPPRPAREPAARRALSFLPQKVTFADALTGREVLEFYRALRGARPERTREVLHFAALNGAGERMVATYSGGMLQRLGLAVALLPDAPLTLLDEPTAALDPDGLCAFYGLVERAREDGRTLFFTSHQLGDAERLADRFAVLVEGRLVACLTAGELKDRLAERGVMRLRLGAGAPGLLEEVQGLAPRALWAGDELLVPGPAAVRPRVLDLVRGRGVEVRGLTAEEGRLDALYRELVAESDPPPSGGPPAAAKEPA
jgi:Cu-processing system ATP-binding protein